MDRLFVEEKAKYRLRGHYYTCGVKSNLQDIFPVRIFGGWSKQFVKECQIDTVGHDKGYVVSGNLFSLCFLAIALPVLKHLCP